MGIVERKFIEVSDTENVIRIKYEMENGRVGYFLADQNLDALTPMLDDIAFTDVPGLFEVTDRIVIDESLTATIYYYVTHRGIPVGCFYCNAFPNEYYNIGLDSSDEYRRWYINRKNRLAQQFSETITSKTNSNVAKNKTLALYKKSVIESENQI